MSPKNVCAAFVFSVLLSALAWSDTKAPQTQADCDKAGGKWVQSQITGQFSCELPPGQPGGGFGGPNPPPNLPADLSIALTWKGATPDKHVVIHLSIGSDIGKALGVSVTNSGTKAAPPGYRLTIALYGQDPPQLRNTLRTTIDTPRVNAGQTVEVTNLDPVRILPSVQRGTYNLCGSLSVTKIDCFPVALELTATSPPRNQ